MSDLGSYFLAQEKTRTAHAEYNAASAKIEMCKVRERAAELRSQHEPLNSMMQEMFDMGISESDRDALRALLLKVGDYICSGRKP